ncbi:MAG: sigma-70 family RNA polymerase sigma factor [Verrucomicrobiota bacterium]
MTDHDLLRRYVEHADQRAFTELVHHHIDLVYATALRHLRGDRHFAQDVTQEVFTHLTHKAASLTRHPCLGGWFYTSTRLTALDLLRREQRRLNRETKAAPMQDTASSADTHWEEIRPVIDDALQELDERDRHSVLLRFFGQKTFQAIGQQLGLTENAAQKRVDRALERLSTALAKRGITSTAAALGVSLGHAAVNAPAALASTVARSALVGVTATAAAPHAGAGLAALFKSTTFLTVGAVTTAVAIGAVSWQGGAAAEPAQLSVRNVSVARAPVVHPQPEVAILAESSPEPSPAPAALPSTSPSSAAAVTTAAPRANTPSTDDRLVRIMYAVLPGDNAFTIAKKTGVSIAALQAANPVYDFSLMMVGDQVVIPSGDTAPAPDSTQSPSLSPTPPAQIPASDAYYVRPGDNLAKIAAKLGTTPEQLASYNPGLNASHLRVGQAIRIR